MNGKDANIENYVGLHQSHIMEGVAEGAENEKMLAQSRAIGQLAWSK